MKKEIRIVKVGGKVVENPETLNQLLDDFKELPDPKILVHGGGNIATQIAQKLGYEVKMIEGRRVTDENMLDVVTMVYGGLVNKKVVAGFQARGCNALGLTGADLNLLKATKRPAVPVDYGLVGDISEVHTQSLAGILKQGITPVIAPLSHDGNGQLFNTNADTIASQLASALADTFTVDLVFCLDKKGVLLNVEDEKSLIRKLDHASYEKLKHDKVIHEGMLPKLESGFIALDAGVDKVFVTDIHALKENAFGGTQLLSGTENE